MGLFGLYDAAGGVPHVLNPPIVIVWSQLKVMRLRMLSASRHLALSLSNMSVMRLQMTVSKDLKIAHNR